MSPTRVAVLAVGVFALCAGAALSGALAPARGAQGGRVAQPRPGVGPADRPRVDAAAADRGRVTWTSVGCITCHGPQARGTDAGPNLVRSLIVLRDRYGNTLGPFLKKGHPTTAARGPQMTDAQIVDLAHFLRQRIDDTLKGSPLYNPKGVVTGDAKAGAAYFNGEGRCTACHSPTGDLAGIASRIADPVDLQQRLLFPGGRGRGRVGAGPDRTAVTVTVTPASGRALTGVLVQMDDLTVSFRDAAGTFRVVRRLPGVQVVKHDPLQAHHELLDRISDQQIHDLVAYLWTLK